MCRCLDRIEALQSHDNVEIYHKFLAILEQYFSTDVNYSFLLFLLGFISMITTTVHIHSVCADNLTITEILEIYFDFELLFFVLI